MKGANASSFVVIALSFFLAILTGCNSASFKEPVITSFAANPTAVTPGGSASLTGVFASGTGLITPGNMTVISGTAVSVSPTQTTVYTLTVTGASGGTAEKTATVTVNATLTAQIITFANPGAQTVGMPLTLSATASSGLTVTFASTTTGVCTVSGTTATFITAGTCSITASQAGNGTYAAATPVSQNFAVNVALTAQIITFANPGAQTVGMPLTLSATASSGLAVSFASTTTGVCTVSGTTATFITAGTCSITASQAGNGTYAAATPVSRSFTVNTVSGASQYTVGGTVSGLTQSGLLLANGADTLAVPANAATFTMPAPVASGSSYDVTVQTQPSGQTCSVANSSGTISSANVTNVAVTCANSSFTPAWQDSKLGAGGFVTDMLVYPDGTELSRTDTYGFFKWNQSSGIWNQLFTAATIPAGDLSFLLAEDQLIGGYAIGACAYPTQSAASLVGTTSILYAVWNATIYKSSNGGVSWVNTGQAVSGADGNNGTQKGNSPYVWCDPASNGQIAYVSTPSGGPMVTTNGGTSWSTVAGIAVTTSNQGSLIVGDPTSSVVNGVTQHIYISSYGTGVYESTNGGTSWTLISGTPTTHETMWVDKFGVLWFLNSGGAELYKRSGGTWPGVESPGSNGGAASLSIDPNSASESTEHIVLLRPSGQLDVSTNGGQTWSGWDWTTSVSATDIPWLGTANQNGGGALYLDVGKAAFDMQSNLLASGGIGAWVALAPVTTSSNYVSQSAGIEQLVVNRIIVPPGSSPLTAVWDRGIFLQKNPDVYPGSQYSNAVGISAGWDADYASSQPDFLVVVNNSNIGEGDFSGYSSDGGNTWTAFAALPNGVQVGGMIAASSPTNWIDVPGQGQGLYCTTDGGQIWNAVQLPGSPGNDWLNAYYLARHVLASDRVQSGVLYAYDAGAGLYSSSGGCDGAWTLVGPKYIDANSSYEGYNSSLQAVPGEAGNLFFSNGPVGCGGPLECPDDFYRSINGGSSWTAVPNVHEVIAFGFGAPKPGSSGYPAIYINGWVNHVYGLWQSVDNASTWTQICTYANNDVDLVTTISGDPNVYGRVYVGFRGSGDAYYDTADACPWVNFSNVNQNASLTGIVTLTAEHSGLVPVSDVQYQVDGTKIGSPITGANPYSYEWDTSTATAGAHTLTVVATGANCSGSFSIPISTH